MSGPMSAQQFLHYMAGTLHTTYVSDQPVPSEVNAKAQEAVRAAQATYAPKYAASGLTPPTSTRELARALVTYKNGTFTMNGRLQVMVDCTESRYPPQKTFAPVTPGQRPQLVDGPPSIIDKCVAAIDYITAPEAQFAAVLRQWDAPSIGAVAQPAWLQAWIQRSSQQAQQMMDAMARNSQAAMQNSSRQFAQAQAQRQASADQFNHDQAVRQNMHNQFLSTMQRGTDMSMARTQDSMNARSTATSDWVDYALDRQTVRDPNTGQVTKVTSGYNATWIDSTGKVSYQTNDVNANPNGVLQGTWTQQNVTHGDGSPH